MQPSKGTARLAGLLYLLVILGGIYSLKIVPDLLVAPGEAAATAGNIAAHGLEYRLGIYCGLLAEVCFVFLGLTLYALFAEVSPSLAGVMLTLNVVVAVLGVVSFTLQSAPLILTDGAGWLSAVPKPQLDALALAFLKLSGIGNELAMVFWGLWLLPFGLLVIGSGFFPKVLGWLLIINCIGWMATGAVAFLLPVHPGVVDTALKPLGIGEPVIMLWMLVMGAKVRPAPALAPG